MTYKFLIPKWLKDKKKYIRKNMEDVYTQRLRFMGVEGCNKYVNNLKEKTEEISVYKPRVLFL